MGKQEIEKYYEDVLDEFINQFLPDGNVNHGVPHSKLRSVITVVVIFLQINLN